MSEKRIYEHNCIFCRIATSQEPAGIVYEDDTTIAFWDIWPRAPVHILIVPKKHFRTVADITEEDAPLMGHLVVVANEVAKKEGIADSGYRLAINCGPDAGQVVWHLHIHLMGGWRMEKLW